MGGAEVLRVLAKAPDRVTKLVGITPVGHSPPRSTRPVLISSTALPTTTVAASGSSTSPPATGSPRFVQSVVDWSRAHSTVEGFRGAVQAWANADFLAEIGERYPDARLAR